MIEIKIQNHDGVRRLDHYLKSYYKSTPKSHIYKMIRKGHIRVNGKRAKVGVRLSPGDLLQMPPAKSTETKPLSMSLQRIKTLQKSIIFEHDDWIIVNKPDTMPVHAGTGHTTGIVDDLNFILQQSVYLVHRLDRQTSGVMILAKNMHAKQALDAMFRERTITKEYELVVPGFKDITDWPIVCSLPLTRVHTESGSRAQVDRHGKAARTCLYKIAQTTDYTLVKAELETGRFHQIRAHAAHMDSAVVGDPWYGGQESDLGMFLHAHRLTFDWLGERHSFCAHWPEAKSFWLKSTGLV